MDNTDSLLELIKVIKKWFKSIVLVCTIAVIGTILISLSMDNYFQATTIFYAASSDLAKPAPIGGFEIPMDYYGRDEDIDRLLSIAGSGELANTIISEFKLAEHYQIKTTTPKGKFKVHEKFQKLFDAKKNKYDAIEVSMEDKDPEIAMQIANRIRNLINEIAQRTVKNSQELLIESYKSNISKKSINLDSLTNRIELEKRKYGIFDTENQGQALAEALGLAKTQSQRDFILDQISEFTNGISKVTVLEQEQKEFGLQLSLDKERFKQLLSAKESHFNAIHLIESAEVPLVKSRPKRSILVIGSALISFFFCVLAALIVEKFKSINWKDI